LTVDNLATAHELTAGRGKAGEHLIEWGRVSKFQHGHKDSFIVQPFALLIPFIELSNITRVIYGELLQGSFVNHEKRNLKPAICLINQLLIN
jgi:hypothetical protein